MHDDLEQKQAADGYRIVGQLVVDGCCSFRVWQRDSATSVEVSRGCESCVGKLREALPATPSRCDLPA